MSESQNTGIGASVRRREDVRFITGKGRYTDDINQAGQNYAVFLRSPHARARIGGIDASAAMELPGVIAVLTGADMAADGLGDLPCGWLVKQKDGSDMVSAPHPPLATSVVNYVGEPYAIVVARTLSLARQAADVVVTDFTELDAVVDPGSARDSEQIHEGVEGNLAYDWEIGDREATDNAMAGAAHVSRLDITNNRLIPNAIEPRAAVGVYESATGEHTLYTTSQNPHLERLVLSAFVQVAPEHK
ncbi:MAG: molybdopterin-dependent oxidoreductase, partial [Gammaproteobacteria bacterium]